MTNKLQKEKKHPAEVELLWITFDLGFKAVNFIRPQHDFDRGV